MIFRYPSGSLFLLRGFNLRLPQSPLGPFWGAASNGSGKNMSELTQSFPYGILILINKERELKGCITLPADNPGKKAAARRDPPLKFCALFAGMLRFRPSMCGYASDFQGVVCLAHWLRKCFPAANFCITEGSYVFNSSNQFIFCL